MSSTATSRFGVDDLGPEALLAAVRDNERLRREADLRQLHLAYQWCVLHPPTADTGVAVWGGDGDLDADESLGGDGTPHGGRVRARTLRPRPRRVHRHRQDPPGRRPRPGPPAPAHLAPPPNPGGAGVAGPPPRPEDPHPQREGRRPRRPAPRPPPAHRRRHPPRPGRRPRHREVHARGARRPRSTLPADLGRHPPPPEPHRVRRHQRAPHHRRHPHPHQPLRPDLRRRRRPQDQPATTTRSGSARPKPSRTLTGTPKTKLYLHLDLADVVVSTGSTTEHRVGRVENLGPATTAKIRAWLGDTSATIQPVLRMDRDDAVDAHDPPAWMRDLVILRDPTCVFPHCERHSTQPATSTTSCRSTTPDHPAKPDQPTSPRSADDTTAPRPAADGPTNADPMAPTTGVSVGVARSSAPAAARDHGRPGDGARTRCARGSGARPRCTTPCARPGLRAGDPWRGSRR